MEKDGEETRDMTGGWEGGRTQEKCVPVSPRGRRSFFFTLSWRSCFDLTLDIDTLVGWECARCNSLISHLARFIKLFWFVRKGEGRILLLCVRAPAFDRELCQCRLPFSLTVQEKWKVFLPRATQSER